jgi:hypothetical protein
MQELSILFEDILNENPNQAIKFLKDKKLDPGTNNKGKQILDSILNITRGDGFTFLLTKIHINERMPFNELQQLYTYLKQHKNELTRLPKPVVNYETYRGLMNDIDNLFGDIKTNWLLKQLSSTLRQQVRSLDARGKLGFSDIAKNFGMLNPDKQKHFMKKVFGYKDIHIFMTNIIKYIEEVRNEQDYDTTKAKIEGTTDAFLVYDNPQQDILIAHIDSFEAMKALACTSAWCIARDMARYRQYMSGGNYYFLIWDYNYPINDMNFFTGTAYNPRNPSISKTHEHLNDRSLQLPNVIEQKELDISIFDNYIEEFKQKKSEKYNNAEGLLKALKESDSDVLLDMIKNSITLREYQTKQPTVNWSGEEIELGIKEDEMKEMLELGYEFDYIVSASYSHGGSNYDSEESNYMHGALSKDNIELLVQLAKILGVPQKEYNKFKNTEGSIKYFLEKHKFDDLIDTYLSEYSDAQDEAEEKAAQELIDKIPFDVSGGTFKIDKMFQYYIDNELTANNFDELIEQIKNLLPEFSYDSISESRYTDMDIDELNRVFKKTLTELIGDVEDDEDSPVYIHARMLRDSTEYLKKLGFKTLSNNDNNFAKLSTKLGTIVISNVGLEDEEDSTSRIMVTARLRRKGSRNIQKIKVPLTSIKNYVNQFQLPLQERLLTFKKILAEIEK